MVYGYDPLSTDTIIAIRTGPIWSARLERRSCWLALAWLGSRPTIAPPFDPHVPLQQLPLQCVYVL